MMKSPPSSLTSTAPRVLFLNQVAGPLFRELAEDVAVTVGRCLLLTGHSTEAARQIGPALEVVAAPDYDRRGLVRRAVSWLAYFIVALRLVFRVPRDTLLFIVSNPPFLPLAGWLARSLRGQRYVVLVYDVYPTLLENLGHLKRNGVVARLWRWFNRLTWRKAERIFTIGNYMAANIQAMLPPGTASNLIEVIPNWADGEFIKPLPKQQNWFARQHSRADRLTVLYSGNLGSTHDIETLLKVASLLKGDATIEFLIIGSGAKWPLVQQTIAAEGLTNVTLLPFQPEKDLPFTLTVGDVAIVSLEKGIEGLSVPSKTFYAMASGAALLGIARRPNEVTEIIEKHECGLVVEPGDVRALTQAIRRFQQDRDFLLKCQQRSRAAMERHFSRANTGRYAAALRPYCSQT
jgi:glycosyltransferase involved in cell wall biosynthesis